MGEILNFVPGEPDKPTGPLAGYFHPLAGAVVRAYVEAFTSPGDVVIDPFCEGPAVLHHAVRAGRHVVCSSFNPLAAMSARLALAPPARRHLDGAVTRLGTALRMAAPFREHIERLYAARCPRCGRFSPADAFTWDRDSDTIFRAEWRCRHCVDQTAPPVLGDNDARQEKVEKGGLHYWYTLDRIAPTGDPFRERAQQLLELYTPRNLYALSSLLMKIESLFADDETQHVLKLLLLSCLDTCSSLYGPGLASARHRLRPPAHFVERNVWHTFVATASEFPTRDDKELFPLTDDLGALMIDDGSVRAALLPFSIHRLVASLPSGCAALVIASPPRPDPALWALSWLWTGWLFGHQVAAPLKPLLRQWRVDWDWYARTMQAAFLALRPLLADGASLVLAFDSPNPAMLEALALALAGAGYVPVSWIRQGDTHACRLISHRTPSLPMPPVSTGRLADAICTETLTAVRHLIAARGEPLAWDDLRLPTYQRLATSGLLGQAAAAEDLPLSPRAFFARQVQDAITGADELVCLEEAAEIEGEVASPPRWWLQRPGPAAPPLDTRVEATVHQLLLSTLMLTSDALAAEVYRRFPGELTPEMGLIETCLRSYGREITPGHWQLRLEDQSDRRAAEATGIRQELRQLGERLDFKVSLRTEPSDTPAPDHLPAFDVLWCEGGQPAYAFAIQWTARVHDLLLSEPPAGAQPCLVIPGGRAALVAFKLRRDPRLGKALIEANWQFIKYRHLRRILAEENLDRHVLKQIFGLDPIIERDGAQMPLF